MLRTQSLNRPPRVFAILYLLVSLVLWGFVWTHAFSMDMTHDEAYSYRLIKTNYFIALFGTANTHWLNTFFMEVFNMVLGDAPGWLRLHSVLAFPFFALAIYRLGQLIKGLPAQVIFYALVLLNPYLLDFFSLARGYGLAMTFQAWSIVYFVKAGRAEFQYRNWLLVVIFNTLAIGSNLSYFYTVTGMAGYYVFLLAMKRYSHRTAFPPTAWRIVGLYVLLILLTIADLLFIKYYGKDLEYGGDDLISSLFGSVWQGSLYGATYGPLLPLLIYVSFYGVVLVCAYYAFGFVRSRTAGTGFLLSIPLISILVLNLLFHALFNTPFLVTRTALQWYVPGLLLLCFAGSEWLSSLKSFRFVGAGIATLLLVTMAAHFYYCADPRLCFEWSLQANTRQAVYDLYAQKPQRPAVSFTVGGVYKNYYTLLDNHLQPQPAGLPDHEPDSANPLLRQTLLNSDYIITAYPVTLLCLQQMGLRYEVIKTYPPGNDQLIRIYH